MRPLAPDDPLNWRDETQKVRRDAERETTTQRMKRELDQRDRANCVKRLRGVDTRVDLTALEPARR